MNARRNRFNLCLVRKSESPMSPIRDRSLVSTDEHNNSGCSTPINSKKHKNSMTSDSPATYDCDQSPIPLSQDTSNLVSGVSWAWNSPKRVVASTNRQHLKPLRNNNLVSYKDVESFKSDRKNKSHKNTGFYKFQYELKLLQENDDPTSNKFEIQKVKCDSSHQANSPSFCLLSSDEDHLVRNPKEHKNTTTNKENSELLTVKLKDSSEGSDSFNNSEFDNLLLQASQAVDRDESIGDKTDVKETSSCSSVRVIQPTSPSPSPEDDTLRHRKTNYRSSITQCRESHMYKPLRIDLADSFDNSDLDNLLLQASQAAEKQINTTDNLKNGLNMVNQPDKKRSFFKSKTADNFDSNSDDSFPESEFELLMQHVALPDTTKTNENRVAANNSQISSDIYSRKGNILTRHKSMPESPGYKMLGSESREVSKNKNATVLESSSSNCTVMLIPNHKDAVGVESLSDSTSIASSIHTSTDYSKRCSKEEIELKRQEALKRHASRLKRLMQGNHSQCQTVFMKSNLK